MKVINLEEIGPWSKEINCACGAKLCVGADDYLVGRFNGSYCESGDRHFYIICARCGEQIVDDKIPPMVKTRAQRKSDID